MRHALFSGRFLSGSRKFRNPDLRTKVHLSFALLKWPRPNPVDRPDSHRPTAFGLGLNGSMRVLVDLVVSLSWASAGWTDVTIFDLSPTIPSFPTGTHQLKR